MNNAAAQATKNAVFSNSNHTGSGARLRTSRAELAADTPARIISKTILPGGTVKIEIGDDHVLTLTPREDRALGALQARAGQEHAEIQVGDDAMSLACSLALKIRELERQVKALKASTDNSQLSLTLEGEQAGTETIAGQSPH